MRHLGRFVSIATGFLLNLCGSVREGGLAQPRLNSRQCLKTHLRMCTFALFALSAFSGPVFADSSGTITYLGHTVQLKYAYAFRHPYLSDKTKQAVTLALAERPFDAAALNDSPIRESELSRQLSPSEMNMVEITLAPEGAYSMIHWQVNGERSGFGLDWYKFDVKQIDGTHIVGTLHSKHDSDGLSDKGSSPTLTAKIDLQFAIDFPGPANFGTPLPADGGEPGKAYLAYNTALDKSDFDALGKTWDKKNSNWLQDRRKRNDFKDTFRQLQMTYLMPHPKINQAFVKGDKATLFVSGEDIDRHASEFIVFLHQEDGGWRVGDLSVDHRPGGAAH
jgi:hypothetical protein